MYYSAYDYQIGKERMVDMRGQVEHNHLRSRLAKARLSKGTTTTLSEAISPRRSIAAQGAALVMALFR